jgi:rubrerythrin
VAAGITRRSALTAAALGVASCGGGDAPPARGPRPGSGAGLLNSVLALEHAGIAAYAAAARLAGGDTRAHLRVIADQEADHVARLSELIEGLGGHPVQGRPAAEYERTFPRLRGERDALLLARDLEERMVRAHLDALAKLPAGELRRAAAAMAAGEAEHLALVRDLAGAPPSPGAFVTGTS